MTVRFARPVVIAAGALYLLGLPAIAKPPFRDDRIIVKPRHDLPAAATQAIHAGLGAQIHREYPRMAGLQVVRLPRRLSIGRALARYRATGLFEYVVPDYYIHITVAPSDPYFTNGTLWAMHNTGQSGGVADADIDAPEAWDIRTNATNVVCAVVDTGVRYTHEDLRVNMWSNVLEVAGNGLDDDGNGYVDDVYGINAFTNAPSAKGNPMDDNGHGSVCSGIIGATGNNATGVVGVAWGVRIMALKAFNSTGQGATSDIIECLDYAITNGAHIVNASWGELGAYDQPLLDAVTALRAAGILFVPAAGNNSLDLTQNPVAPASYDLDNIVTVTATDRFDAQWYNYGADIVELGAPGKAIVATGSIGDNAYSGGDGTSFAAPHVVGALALVKAEFPSETYTQLIHRVLGNVDGISSLTGKCVTSGRLNVYRALSREPSPVARFTASPPAGGKPLAVTFTDESWGNITNRILTFGDGGSVTNDLAPSHTYTNDGVYNVRLTAWGPQGVHSRSNVVVVATNYYMQTAPYAWVDPSSHTALTLTDDSVSGALTLPFNFPFFASTNGSIIVGSNGLLGFNAGGMTYLDNADMPFYPLPNQIICPYWCDLYPPAAGAQIRFGTVGSVPGKRVFVVTWLNVPHVFDLGAPLTFQAMLYETSGQIVFQYQNVQPTNLVVGAGRPATIGVEHPTGRLARKFSHLGSTLVTNEQAVAFSLAPPAPPAAPGNLTAYGFTDAGGASRVELFWLDAADNETGYRVERSTNGVDFVSLGVVATGSGSFVDTGVSSLTNYTYRVIAIGAGGDSTPSGTVALTPPAFNTWQGAATGATTNDAGLATVWSDTGNWSASVVPGTQQEALLVATTNGTVRLDANVTVGALTFTGTVSAATFDLGGRSFVATYSGTHRLDVRAMLTNGTVFQLYGPLTLAGNASVLISNSATLLVTNATASSVLQLAATATVDFVAGQLRAHVLRVGTNATLRLGGGTLNVDTTMENNGTLASAFTNTVAQTMGNVNGFTINATGRIVVESGTLVAGKSVFNFGTVDARGSGAFGTSITFNNNGTIINTNGVALGIGADGLKFSNFGTIAVRNGGTITLFNAVTAPFGLTPGQTGRILLGDAGSAGTLRLGAMSNGGTIQGQGTLTFGIGGSTPSFVNAAGMRLTADFGPLVLTGLTNFLNQGTVTIAGGLAELRLVGAPGWMSVSNTALILLSGGTFSSVGANPSVLSNATTGILRGCGTVTNINIVNRGTIAADCVGGTLTFAGTVTNFASIVATNGGFLAFRGPVVNSGSIVTTNGSARFYSTVINTGTIVLDAAGDADGDGISNGWEQGFGLNPLDPNDAAQDNDGDGYTNVEEFSAGTAPNDANAFPRAADVAPSGNDMVVTIPSVIGKSYQLQYRDALETGSWTDTGSPQAGTGGALPLTDSGGAMLPARFYRVKITP